MAVWERLDLALVQELLEAATGAGDELRTVVFENQVVEQDSVPDARISARFTWWFETKTARGAYTAEGHNRRQLRHHSERLAKDREARLFVLTPDPVRPAWFDELDGVREGVRPQILWLGFRELADAITRVITDPTRLVDGQTKFLLSELVALYEADGLLTTDDTVIVAARSAWPEYRRFNAYTCQPNRSFRAGLTHFGFYTDGAIQPLIPRIRAQHPAIVFSREKIQSLRDEGEIELAELIEGNLDPESGRRTEGSVHDVVLLTAPDDPETVDLGDPIVNDVTAASGRPWAWTLSQRYSRLDRLRTARRTSEL